MNRKIVKTYIYEGLGFPIQLHNVEMLEVNDEFHPKIDVKEIAKKTIRNLVLQKSRLTGNQIKFIRAYFMMSLREFAKVVNESHQAVKKWESFGDEETKMDKNIEIMLRLHIYDNVVIGKAEDEKKKERFHDQFVELKIIFAGRQDPKRDRVCQA